MQALLDQIRHDEQQTRADALGTYRELLGRRENPQTGDADTLRRVMAILGLTARDVEGDAHALATFASKAKHIRTPDQLREATDTLNEAREAFAADLRQLLRDMVDSLAADQLPRIVELLLPAAGAPPKGTGPFWQQRDAIVAKWVAAQNQEMTVRGLHEQASREAEALRAKHPRAFAD